MTPPFVPAEELPLRDPYYTDFAIEYDQHTNGVRGDIEFYRKIALSADGPVIELGVGTGRTAIPAALAGTEVLGLDLSPEMLALCRSKAAEVGVSTLSLAVADMRQFALARPVDLVVIPHRAFLHNLTMGDQLATLASCRAALRPGGRLALNVFNPDLAKMVEWMLRGPEDWEDREAGPAGAVHRHDYDPSDQRCDSTIMLPGTAFGGASRSTSATCIGPSSSTCWHAPASRSTLCMATSLVSRSGRCRTKSSAWRGRSSVSRQDRRQIWRDRSRWFVNPC